MVIHGISIRSKIRKNRDGIDVDSCRNVRIPDCSIDTGDDAIVLKATTDRPCQNVVISNCVINLAPEKAPVFSEIARVLKPGGQFSISDIVVDTLPDWIRESAAAWSACVAGAISEQDYVTGLEAAGLQDVQVIERMVYDACQLRAILSEDIPGLDLDMSLIESLLEEHAGAVWSAKFTGRKPGQG